MKKQLIVLLTAIMWHASSTHANVATRFAANKKAQDESSQPINNAAKQSNFWKSEVFRQMTPRLLYSYLDFHFDSTQTRGYVFNRFQGHSDIYTAGVEAIKLQPSIYSGLSIIAISTQANSQVELVPIQNILTSQNSKNTTLFAHIMKVFTPHISVDISGAYGQSTINAVTTLTPNIMPAPVYNQGRNWLGGINGIYNTTYKKFGFIGVVGAVYNEVHLNTSLTNFMMNPLVNETFNNSVTFINESAELGYALTDSLRPFIYGGLIQVAAFTNSRPLIAAETLTVAAGIPQLNLNRNAYRVGAGVALLRKNYRIRVDQQYYNSANTLTSNQTNLGVDFILG